jgi:hypothetical protein
MVIKCGACSCLMVVENPPASRSLCSSCEPIHREATQALMDLALEAAVNSNIEEAA